MPRTKKIPIEPVLSYTEDDINSDNNDIICPDSNNDDDNDRTVIDTGQAMHLVFRDVAEAIRISNAESPWLFRYNAQLYHADANNKITPLHQNRLEIELNKRFTWLLPSGRGGRINKLILEYIARDEEAGTLPLHHIVQHPVYLQDGTIAYAPGYYEDGALYMEGNPFATAMQGKTLELLSSPEEALEVLKGLFCQFPFADSASLTHVLVGTLQPYMRFYLSDMLRPGYLINAPKPGVGKTLIAKVMTLLGQGYASTTMPIGGNDEETRKRLFAVVDSRDHYVFLDNVDFSRRLFRSVLAQIMTSRTIRDRRLYQSDIEEKQVTTNFIINGIRANMSDELTRRFVPILLTGIRPDPQTLLYPDLINEVRTHQVRYTLACLTLCQHYIAQGLPRGNQRSLNSYEAWCGFMGGLAESVGLEDFLGNIPKFQDESAAILALQEVWYRTYKTEEVTASNILSMIESDLQSFRSLLSTNNKKGEVQSLGKLLCRFKDKDLGNGRKIGCKQRGPSKFYYLVNTLPASQGASQAAGARMMAQ